MPVTFTLNGKRTTVDAVGQMPLLWVLPLSLYLLTWVLVFQSRPLLPQYAVIALTLAFTDLVVMAGYTALASRVLRALKAPAHLRAMNRSFGALFVVAGTLLAFATAPGQVALDGDGENSPFSSALSRHIGTPDLEVQQMLTRVRAEVVAVTRNKQVPVLGDIPLIGSDFRDKSNGLQKTELVIFLRPVVVRDSALLAAGPLRNTLPRDDCFRRQPLPGTRNFPDTTP